MVGIRKFSELSLELNFLNGSVMLPSSYGGYVVSSGCGSGKTTVIKMMIHEYFHEGVLYSAGTIQECDEMYEWLMNNAVGKPNSNGRVMSRDDIIVLHSENEDSRYAYRIEPERLIPKTKVVICTHYKLLHDHPCILMRQSFFHLPSNDEMTLAMRAVIGENNELPRQWVLIDEVPSSDILKTWFSMQAKALMYKVEVNSSFHYDEALRSVIVDSTSVKMRGHIRAEMESLYNKFVKGSSIDPFLDVSNSNTDMNKPKELRRRLLLDSFWRSEMSYTIDNPIDPEEITGGFVSYSVTQMISRFMRNKIIIFEGTGDLTFGLDNSIFQVIDLPCKYNSICNFTMIDSLIRRRNMKESFLKNNYIKIEDELKKCCSALSGIIHENEKTLIVTWKNLKIESNNPNKKAVKDDLSIMKSDIFYNSNFNLPEYITNGLMEIGVPRSKFEVIHYRSGLDRSTNEFRDCDSIVFLGEFHVPTSAIDDFNRVYCSRSDQFRFGLYHLVQSICRTRIRNHDGKGVNVYMTKDWGINIIVGLEFYMNVATNSSVRDYCSRNLYRDLSEIKNTVYECLPDKPTLKDKSGCRSSSNKWDPILRSLEVLMPGVTNSVYSSAICRYEVDLDDLYNVYPMKRKAVSRYSPLVNYLKKFNTELIITSNRGK